MQVDGASSITTTAGEIALDTEIAHGVAPGSHLTYWLAHDNTNTSLEDALNAAANSSVSIVSNSWGCASACFDPIMESALQHGAATGKTFYFSTGDKSENLGAQYPAYSQYAVAVGGTNLGTDASGNWSSETGWGDGAVSDQGSGGGCASSESRPAWQIGVGAATCSGRAIPDVSADADPATCAYIFVSGVSACAGGTSLSAPIWAAIAADWNVVNAAAGKSALGFSAPLLYQLGANPATEAIDFHDVTSGNNGFAALPGWDQVTGWGSPNLGNLSATVTPGAPTGATATAGDKQATVAFTPPAANPAVGDSWYTVTASPGGQHASGTRGPDHGDRADERDELHVHGDGDEQRRDGACVGRVEQCRSGCAGDGAGCPDGRLCGRRGHAGHGELLRAGVERRLGDHVLHRHVVSGRADRERRR